MAICYTFLQIVTLCNPGCDVLGAFISVAEVGAYSRGTRLIFSFAVSERLVQTTVPQSGLGEKFCQKILFPGSEVEFSAQ